MIQRSGRSPLIQPVLNDITHFQLDAIPTVGFSDPIFSYLSAVQFIFDGVRMLKDGYEKVHYPFLLCFSLDQTDDPPALLDKTRSIQNLQFSEMDGAGCRI